MILDSGVKHQRRAWRRVCRGCGQQWPCFVAIARRASRRERRAAEEADPCACVDCRRTAEAELDDLASRTW